MVSFSWSRFVDRNQVTFGGVRTMTTNALFRSFKKGTVVFDRGDGADYAYLVQAGEVQILARDGTIIETMKPGDFFG